MTPADEYERLMLAVVVAARKAVAPVTMREHMDAMEELRKAVVELDA
jgi:hypothetical protein